MHLSPLQKLLAVSVSLAGVVSAFGLRGDISPVHAASGLSESPAQLRLSALETLMRGDKENAAGLYKQAINQALDQFGENSTFLGDLYYETGRLYLSLDQFNVAEDYLKKAVKVNPKNASARLSLAKLLDLQEKVQDSIGQTREALMINPASPVARQKFIQTLSKYGASPSDKAIVNQESLTIAVMQKAAKLSLLKSSGASDKSAEGQKKSAPPKATAAVPTLPKNLVPLKDNGEKPAETKAVEEDLNKVSTPSEPPAKTGSSSNSSTALSLFPLKGMSERKKQDELKKQQQKLEEQKKQAEEAARKKNEEAAKKAREADLVEKIKEQARRRERERAEKARAEKAPPTKPEKSVEKPKAKPKAEADKPAQQPQQVQQIQQVQPIQQVPVQMAPPMFMPPQMVYPMQQPNTPKPAKKAGFVPPPPPTMNMYPVPQVVPQMVPQAKPAAPKVEKPKVEKPKAVPKEEKPAVEDKPPPMASPGESADPDFLLDWGELPKKTKKKGK